MKKTILNLALMGSLAVASNIAFADSANSNCSALPDYAALKSALSTAQNGSNGGFGLEMWGTIVDRDGVVCAVAFTGDERGAQWPGKSCHISSKSQYGQCVQPTRPGPVHSQPLHSYSGRWQPIWPAI